MDHRSRLIGLAFVAAWTIFRLVRYLRVGAARRPPPAGPPSAGTSEQPRADTAVAPTATASPIEPAGAPGAGLARHLLAGAVFIPGTALLWSLLFMLPALADVPPIVRMVAGVLATLYLLQLARRLAARRLGAGQRGIEDNNPIK